MLNEAYTNSILKIASGQLDLIQYPSDEDIQNAVDSTLALLKADENTVTNEVRKQLIKVLKGRHVTFVERTSVSEDNTGHLPWLPARRSAIRWKFWDRYQRWLDEVEKLPKSVVSELNNATDNILERLEDPEREGSWDRRGMVVGHVQSGKTSNYIGLACKAADAGYKLIIILTGIHSSLRSQTQERFDLGFLGFDTQRSQRFEDNISNFIGAGKIKTDYKTVAHSLTSSSEKGDFNKAVARQIGVSLGGDPVLLVVKKNTSVLKNLLEWATMQGQVGETDGRLTVGNIPLLLIDDEADNASVNTKDMPLKADGTLDEENWDPTKINGRIRDILRAFSKSVYVAYTATPFANIFINPEVETKQHGRDLFPESFIIGLKAPDNYVGPKQIFGLGEDREEPWPIVRVIDDPQETPEQQEHEIWVPRSHKATIEPGPVPLTLKKAILSFILSCAVRRLRGQGESHSSMLIHATRYNGVQQQIFNQVKGYVEEFRSILHNGSGADRNEDLELLKLLWEKDYIPTTQSMIERKIIGEPLLDWKQVKKELLPAAEKIQLRQMNGTAKDILDYRAHKQGLSLIAIGGDKLSRGLTLDGLCVSYFLRSSRMYDTLMQMGRWFGYRSGYQDLCRLYTTQELVDNFEHIAISNQELRNEFDIMCEQGLTPREYGLRVRMHHDNLLITALNKMKSGTELQITFSNSLKETTQFERIANVQNANLKLVKNLIQTMGAPQQDNNYFWKNVPAAVVAEFIRSFRVPLRGSMRPDLIAQFIEQQQPYGELVEWTVMLRSASGKNNTFQLGDLEVGRVERSEPSGSTSVYYRVKKDHVVDRGDEAFDLKGTTLWDEALELTNRRRKGAANPKNKTLTKIPGGPEIREKRPKEQGLLLLYMIDTKISGIRGMEGADTIPAWAISFPGSRNSKPVKYLVNNIYWEEEYGDAA